MIFDSLPCIDNTANLLKASPKGEGGSPSRIRDPKSLTKPDMERIPVDEADSEKSWAKSSRSRVSRIGVSADLADHSQCSPKSEIGRLTVCALRNVVMASW